MIRSCRIPNLLKRICDYNDNNGGVIRTAILCTADGELLGSTASTFVGSNNSSHTVTTTTASNNNNTPLPPKVESVDSLGTLIADIAVDYARLGDEYTALDLGYHGTDGINHGNRSHPNAQNNSNSSGGGDSGVPSTKRNTLQCLFLEMELGLIGVSACPGVDCLVIAIASPDAHLGSVKSRLQTIATYVTEALSPLTEMSYGWKQKRHDRRRNEFEDGLDIEGEYLRRRVTPPPPACIPT